MQTVKNHICVFGAGAAGLAAALSAAREGVPVLLLEKAKKAGGTVTHALIHTLGGLFDSAGALLNDGLSKELVTRLQHTDPRVRKRKMGRVWVLEVDPSTYARCIRTWLGVMPGIRFIPNGKLSDLVISNGRIASFIWNSPAGRLQIQPRAVIDATGNASILRQFDSNLVTDATRGVSCGVVFRLIGLHPNAVEFPNNLSLLGLIRAAVDQGELPEPCRFTWIDRGLRSDEAWFKLSLPPLQNSVHAQADLSPSAPAMETQNQLIYFLKKTRKEFAQARLAETGRLGIRDAGAAQGVYRLTEEDVLSGRKFSDAACRCAWPIEAWDSPLGSGPRLRYLPPETFYEIPLRSLKVRIFKNLWVAGKCFSGDAGARASARVVGCCWGMGEAVGRAATIQSMAPHTNKQMSIRKRSIRPLPGVSKNKRSHTSKVVFQKR